MTGIGNWKFAMNEEYLVIASHQLAMITSLPFVHTARRSYQLGKEVRWKDGQSNLPTEFPLTSFSVGRRSRNKVSVGEPAEGSLQNFILFDPSSP